jgi:hypothetical protein
MLLLLMLHADIYNILNDFKTSKVLLGNTVRPVWVR